MQLILLILPPIGWLAAHCPGWLRQLVCNLLGLVVYYGAPRRRRTMLANLYHAFPDRPATWRRGIARRACARMLEMALFAIASPQLSEARLQHCLVLGDDFRELLARWREDRKPLVFFVPHLCLMEMLTCIPAVLDKPLPPSGAMFRPLNQPVLNRWLQRTRERHGVQLLSRRDGFAQASQILTDGGALAVLFDQRAGGSGSLGLSLGRVVITTTAPGLLAQKHRADAHLILIRRTGNFAARVSCLPLDCEPTAAALTATANAMFDAQIAKDESICADWLWLHDRWRFNDRFEQRFKFQRRRDLLPESLVACGLAALPRRTRFWVWLPEAHAEAVALVPLLRELIVCRPDVELTLVGDNGWGNELLGQQAGHEYLARNAGLIYFWQQRVVYPGCIIMLTRSARYDLQAWLTRCPHRIGIGGRRPLLSETWQPPADTTDWLAVCRQLTAAMGRS